jgi:hypothetical protein
VQAIRRVHLIYPMGQSIGCPDAIGRNLASHLGRQFEVQGHRWDRLGSLTPDAGAALLGHPHPNPFSLFRRSASRPGWGRVLMICPFNGDLRQVAWLDPVLALSDAYLAITGSFWMRAARREPFRAWLPRMRQLDLAVDRRDFPRVKRRFAGKGKRSFLFVGHSGWPKNTSYLSRLALAMPEWRFSWAGSGSEPVPGLRALGSLDFTKKESLAIVAEHDFMITLGTADANPATILEAMAWGLIPVCSPQSGYDSERGVINLPLNDLEKGLAVLRRLQQLPESRLKSLVRHNDLRLKSHFHWRRFAGDVAKAILDPAPAAPWLESRDQARNMSRQALASPFAPWRWRWWIRPLKSQVKAVLKA